MYMAKSQERLDRGLAKICATCKIRVAISNFIPKCNQCHTADHVGRYQRELLIKQGLCPNHPENKIIKKKRCLACLEIEKKAKMDKEIHIKIFGESYKKTPLGRMLYSSKRRAQEKGWAFDLENHMLRIAD